MSDTIGVALLGGGRMGLEHARNLLGIPNVHVVAVADPVEGAREAARALCRAERAYAEPEAAIEHEGVEAVVIVTPTNTHADLIEAASRGGRAIFCEKPVALDLERTKRALEAVLEADVPFQIGFQRRYDPAYAHARAQLAAGAVGRVDQFRAVGRDPGPPPLEYLRVSGGQFVDQAIHEFDSARFLVGEVAEVFAWGAARVDPKIGDLGDTDTITTMLRFANGALGVIENSRQAVYGYDILAEVFGERGKVSIEAVPKTPVRRFAAGPVPGGDGRVETDHYLFFMDRFRDAYRLEFEAFFQALARGEAPTPGPADALESLRLALAAARSYREGRPVRLTEVG